MARTCERCSTLRAQMDSGRVETRAIQEDSAALVRFAEAQLGHRIPLFEEAHKRWHAAALEYQIHRTFHRTVGSSGPNVG